MILAVDWLLDRIRTTVNLLSDAYGCLIVDHLLQPSKWREGGAALAAAGGPNCRGELGRRASGGFDADAEEGRGGGGGIGGGSGGGGGISLDRGLPHADHQGLVQHSGPGGGGGGGLLGGRRAPGYVQLGDMQGRE